MCSHYQAVTDRARLARLFGVAPPDDVGQHDLWPGYVGNFCRRQAPAEAAEASAREGEAGVTDGGAVLGAELLTGVFGLVPPWSPDTKISRFTYNARSETVANKPSFRAAWQQAQHCIVPAEAFFEPDWRSGKPLPARISLVSGEPMGLAGLWSTWTSPQGERLDSYTLLTINATQHPLMNKFHKPTDEKRMVVVLAPDQYADWLHATPAQSQAFLRPCPAHLLQATWAHSVQRGIFGD